MLEDGIYSLLLDNSSIVSLVSTRIYPVNLPEDVDLFPCITFQRITTTPEYTMDGPLGLEKVRVQIDAWSFDYGEVKAVAEALRIALDGFSGSLPNGAVVLNTWRDNSTDYVEKESRLARVQTDFVFQYVLPS